MPAEQAALLMPPSPSASPVLKNLSYFSEDNLIANESIGGSIFGGYPSLLERNESFNIKESMMVHCGYDLLFLPVHISHSDKTNYFTNFVSQNFLIGSSLWMCLCK